MWKNRSGPSIMDIASKIKKKILSHLGAKQYKSYQK